MNIKCKARIGASGNVHQRVPRRFPSDLHAKDALALGLVSN